MNKIKLQKYNNDIIERYYYLEEDKRELIRMIEFLINTQIEYNGIDDYLIDDNSKIVVRLKDRIKSKTVLVVGTGTGREVKKFKEMGASDVIGLTLGTKNQRFAKEQLNVNIEIQDCHVLPYDDNTFDIIVALNLVEHLWSPIIFLLECHRVIKETGVICIDTPSSAEHTSDSWLHHILCPTPRQLYALLIKTGFKPTFYNGQDISNMSYESNPPWFDDASVEIYMEAARMDPRGLHRQDLYKYYQGAK